MDREERKRAGYAGMYGASLQAMVESNMATLEQMVAQQFPKQYGTSMLGMVEEGIGKIGHIHAGTMHHVRQQREAAQAAIQTMNQRMFTYSNPCAEINIHGTTTGRTHNDKEDTMSTFTAAQLEETINPTPVAEKPSPARDVRALEKANENAAAEIIAIAGVTKHKADFLSSGRGTYGVCIPEKYQARLQRILADMRKDQEAILNETAAKLAKVTKAIS